MDFDIPDYDDYSFAESLLSAENHPYEWTDRTGETRSIFQMSDLHLTRVVDFIDRKFKEDGETLRPPVYYSMLLELEHRGVRKIKRVRMLEAEG